MTRTLVVTNDFPPRQGGIQSFVHELCVRQPPGSLAVYASDFAGAAAFDAAQPFPVVRHPTGLLLPTPAARRAVTAALRSHGATSVWFGAAASLGLLAPALRAAGATRIVASTHGHETGWAALPGARQVLRRIGSSCDVITYLGEYTRRRLARVVGTRLERLTPGVDVETFTPVDASIVRARYGLERRRVIGCVSRLVPRKGQDVLLRALARLQPEFLDAALLVVGSGPDLGRLQRLARELGVERAVVFTGAVPAAELPAHYSATDVFAMPCRTRRAGLDVEGLGIVFLEASACGRPVVAGDSGGAPDAVREGETGYVIDGRDVAALTGRLAVLLRDGELRARLGAAGRAWVEREWQWETQAQRLHELLHPPR